MSENPASKQITIREYMTEWVRRDIDLCIGCNRCMMACPVGKEEFTIGELNYAAEPDSAVPDKIRDFSFNCVQCGRCVPVCPAGARRDYMVLFIRHKLRESKPSMYSRYLAMKGPFPGAAGKVKQKVFTSIQKIQYRDLSRFMETLPKEKAPLLFYPGCYIYNTPVTKRTIRLLDHVGQPYSVLAGLTTCCGVPQFLQGEFDLADRCLDSLHDKIQMIDPVTVITGCAECYDALLRIRSKHGEHFTVLTVMEYLMQHVDRFPQINVRESITLHDSCRITRRYGRGEVPRAAVNRFSSLVEMENSGPGTMCCYYWNHGHDPLNNEHRAERIREAQGKASTMVCDCVTCFEKYEPFQKDIEVLDILQLFELSLDHHSSSKDQENSGNEPDEPGTSGIAQDTPTETEMEADQ